MRIPKFTILSLIVFVVLVAVGFAALKNPTELWASSIYTVTVGLLLLSLVGAVFGPRYRRPYWMGMAVFGWGYLGHVLLRGTMKPPPLLMKMVVTYLNKQMIPEEFRPFGWLQNVNQTSYYWFSPIAHSLAAILVACFGSFLGRIFRPERREMPY